MHGYALVENLLLLIDRYRLIRQLRNASRVHDRVLVRQQFLLHTVCRQHCGLTHHLLHCIHRAVVAGNDTGNPRCSLPCQNGQDEA